MTYSGSLTYELNRLAQTWVTAATTGPWVAWGDSLTHGTGGGGTSYPSILSTMARGFVITEEGIGGETSTQIAARQNGVLNALSVTGNSIPASGPVVVTANTAAVPSVQGDWSSYGTLVGIPGLLRRQSDDSFLFTRTTAGSVTSCPAGSAFTTDEGVLRRSTPMLLWVGRNNASSRATVNADIAAMVAYSTSSNYLVLSVLNGASEGVGTTAYTNIVTNLNADLATTYGTKFLDVRGYLVVHGLTDAGITATTGDVADVAADIVPRSLRYDSVHLNAAGYSVVATQVYNKLRALGLLTGAAGPLEEQGAANAWAGTTGFATQGALNKRLGTWGIGLDGVCNLLAGTTGFAAPAALSNLIGNTWGSLSRRTWGSLHTWGMP